jgi:hypothetical protein
MGARSIALVRGRYDLARVVEQYRDVYHRVLNGNPTGDATRAAEPVAAEAGASPKLSAGRQ